MIEQPGREIFQLRQAGLVLALALAAVSLPASPAAAANTLEGTCRLSGQFKFDEPLGNELRRTGFRDRASGTCTGTLNGVPVDDAPVVLRATGSGTVSCLAGHTTSSGWATFTRGTEGDVDDVRIRFWTEATGGLTQFAARFGGAVSGEGVAYVNFLPYADESALAACQAGTLKSARYDLVTRTVTPMVG
jgi:hypothetical protein